MASCFLRWSGSKEWARQLLAPLLAPEEGGRVLDPFCGSACVHLSHPHPVEAGDSLTPLIHLLSELQRDAEGVLAAATRFVERGLTEGYAAARERLTAGGPAERAGAFLFLNHTSHFPYCRFNMRGEFNLTPKLMRPLPLDPIRASLPRLQQLRFRCADWRWAEAEARAGDTVLFDPPYLHQFRRYGPVFFEGHYEVAAAAERLRARGVTCVVTLNDSPETRSLLGEADEMYTASRRLRLRGEVAEVVAVFRRRTA